uniref:RdRp n=1 Tax=Cercospora beticola negative-stranded virus 2 TaxID=2973210 RepID=A0A976XIM5_9MONO|nr:RdRp [Cercospora beticola negative-stranded virus 2]
MDRTSIAKSIATIQGAATKVFDIISGTSSFDYMPENSGQYSQYRRCMHDVICAALLDSGHYKYTELTLSDFGITIMDKKIKMQKPDLFMVQEKEVLIGEVTCTYSPEQSIKEKIGKYHEFIKILENNGFNVTFTVHTVDLTNPDWSESLPFISKQYVDIFEDMLTVLRNIHTNPKFSAIRKSESGSYSIDRFQFKLEDETLTSLVEECTTINMEPSKIKAKLKGTSRSSDQFYVDQIAQSILSNNSHPRPRPNPRSFEPTILIKDLERMKSVKPTTSKLPRILQLGCPSRIVRHKISFEDSILELKSSGCHGGYLDYILSSLQDAEVPKTRMIKLALPISKVESEQKSGPGRKSYMKKHGISTHREVPTHIGISANHIKVLDDFISQIKSDIVDVDLPQIKQQDDETAGLSASLSLDFMESKFRTDKSTAISYFYQVLSNEIVLNSMRRRSTREYALGYTSIRGVYFIVAPGPQLRTESNVEFIKIISLVPGISNGLSSPWHSEGDHWESDWLSVDTDRLKHWQRSRDRTIMCTVSNAERLVRPGVKLRDAIKVELESNNHALMTLTYLENKQTTSTTNQTIRYLWMKSLGDKDFKDLLKKMPQRVNSIIQSSMLQKAVETCIRISKTDLTELVTVGKVIRDDDTGNYDESTTGVANLMPRLFTYGGPVPLSYNLNEIYWCMAYNKDRQNKTQDAMRILDKILKEEQKYDNEINSRLKPEAKVNYLLGTTTIQDDINHIHTDKPESHYFSYRAVQVGISLQDSHIENRGEHGSWLNNQRLSDILSKNLSEFSTFKASVKKIERSIDPNDLNEIKKIGQRTKAIELVAEIVQDEKLQTSMDVAMTFSGINNRNFEILIQIFKKNQIGGVREIIILIIKARILFNIVEEVARLLSKSDSREILTKGKDKRLMMRSDYEAVLSSFDKGTPIQIVKESYDMTTWAQKFIPTIFIPLFEHHFREFPGMIDLSRLIFLSHSNKKMEYPKGLLEQWIKHPTIKHDSEAVQSHKEEFIKTGKPYFVNHSNMCQGIPHYNSTVLALACLSLRDSLFKSCLKQLNVQQHIQWKTRVGSDDKGTIIGIDRSKSDSYFQYILLGQCERAAERLFSMELSVKSASGHLMYELNSAFMANLETLSPTIKFACASTDTIGTSSCTSFINESYSRIRQMRENGCSSIVCSFAHSLNMDHFYNIFSTGFGMENDVSMIFKCPPSEIPYDFGIYPLYDVDLQDIVGPEYHNYRILKQNPKSNLCKLLYTEINSRNKDELFPAEDAPLLKKDHFGIHQGLVRQLENMKTRLNAKSEDVEKFFEENPFLMIRGPETLEETKYSIISKLFTKGAAESLRRTSAAIYIGRLSAFKTSESWIAPYDIQTVFDLESGESDIKTTYIKTTYSEFLKRSLTKVENSKSSIDLESMKRIIFPQWKSFDVVSTFVGRFGAVKTSTKHYSQAVRTWTVNNFNYEFSSSLKSIIETSFGLSQDATEEDIAEFKRMMSMKLSSIDQFKDECKSKNLRPLDVFYYMTKIYKSSRTSKIQTFANGPTTSGLHMTALALKRYNHMPGASVQLDVGMDEDDLYEETSLSNKLDKIKLFYNISVMKLNDLITGNVSDFDMVSETGSLSDECRTIIRSIRSLSGFDNITQKTLKMAACQLLQKSELKAKLLSWRSINYSYIKKQIKRILPSGSVKWSGDLSILVNSEDECFTLNESNGSRFIVAREVNDLSSIYRSLRSMCSILDFEFTTMFVRCKLDVGDVCLSSNSKSLIKCEIKGVEGLKLKMNLTPNFRFRRLTDMQSFDVKFTHNKKTGEIEVYLTENGMRTATICHSNGNYYPVEIPPGYHLTHRVEYLGVDLESIFRNRSWFYNFRLPMMNEKERLRFLNECVDYDIILSQTTKSMQRIHDYMEVREEVNEESFSVIRDHMQMIRTYDTNTYEGVNMMEVFRQTMDSTDMPTSLTKFSENLEDWAQDVQDSLDNEIQNLVSEETLELTRGLGYKKPAPKRAMATISGLQQGSILKDRVLDCFFQSQNIRNESSNQLPHMFVWLDQQSLEATKFPDSLLTELKNHIIKSIVMSSGATPNYIRNKITESMTYSIPIQMLYNLLNSRTITTTNIMEEILNETNDDYNSESGDSDLDV